MDLREEDLGSALGMEHKLHRRKLLLAREKLRPLSEYEQQKKDIVRIEEKSDRKRKEKSQPNIETVFRQARHGRIKSLEDSLDDGFDIGTQDESGNTLLMVAVQNDHRKMIEFLIRRGANVNQGNTNGNTPLHYALAYDTTGQVAEYLIERGADDMVENAFGLSCYDGVGDNENKFN